MARCDQGYLCQICGEEVKRLDQSLLYLRYVIGWITAEQLTQQPEAHLGCTPSVAQFIVAEDFVTPDLGAEPAAKCFLDPEFRQAREALLTAGYVRLSYLQKHRRQMPIAEYPLSAAASVPTQAVPTQAVPTQAVSDDATSNT